MFCIVPLAGPDFYSEKFGIRPLMPYKNMPLIEYVLKSRPWMGTELDTKNIIFILRKTDKTPQAEQALQDLFPGSQQVLLSKTTNGALLSALAGIPLIPDSNTPVIVDLADIAYKTSISVGRIFDDPYQWAGAIPYFESDNANYSYLEMRGEEVIRTREKEVISRHASAGTYFFRNSATYLDAVRMAVQHPDQFSTNNSFFVCPVYNALIRQNKPIAGVPVCEIEEISLLFKT